MTGMLVWEFLSGPQSAWNRSATDIVDIECFVTTEIGGGIESLAGRGVAGRLSEISDQVGALLRILHPSISHLGAW